MIPAAPRQVATKLALTPALYAMLCVLGVISIVWNVAAALLYPVLPAERGRTVGRAGIARGYGLFWRLAAGAGMLRIDATALDALREERGLIIVANHPSMLDAMILVARLPRAACIMKADLMRNAFLGAGARLARYIRNDSARVLVRQAVADLRHGGQLVMFPEGTRTIRAPINPFRPGVTLIAKLADVPIQAVFIDTESPYLREGWPLWRLPPLPIVFRVRLGRRFEPRPDSAAQLLELERYFLQALECECGDERVAA
ncbi:MAG TPA: lysophospholipid acyltransferase family protein [Burkholderiaceae bacterium]|nr:lysophospholipid acyltransferase family protein [Burkholderiaceae bacterium]